MRSSMRSSDVSKHAVLRTGPIPAAHKRARSTTTTEDAASTSKTRAVTYSRSSRARTAASCRNCLHRFRQRGGLSIPTRTQALDRAGVVVRGSVLAQLPLAFEPSDRDLDADDPPQHLLDERFGCVRDVPRIREGDLLEGREACDEGAQPADVVNQLEWSVGVDCDVVPGR